MKPYHDGHWQEPLGALLASLKIVSAWRAMAWVCYWVYASLSFPWFGVWRVRHREAAREAAREAGHYFVTG